MKRIISILVMCLCMLAPASAQYDKDVFSWRGRSALAEGKYSEAMQNFNVLARLDTTDYWNFFYRGIAKYNLGDIRGAQQDFNRCIRLDPVFTNGYHYRAITYGRFGDYDAALKDLEEAIRLRPGYMGLYYTRGVTYFLAQKFDLAVADFNRFIKKEPKDPGAYLNRGASYLFLGDTLKALSDYNRAIKLDRFEPEGYIRRGRVNAMRKKYAVAIADMNKAIELDSTNTFAYFNRAIMHFDRNDYNSAMADFNRVLKDEPGNALTLYNRSLINARVGNFEDALDDMDRVININPKNVLAYFNRAAFFMEMQRWRDALEDYDKAIELYPDFAKAYMNRSYVKNRLGMLRESKADYETAQRKVAEYKARNEEHAGSFADTTKKYSALLSLDTDFAKKDFDNELLQHRDIDIRLRPLYKFVLSPERQTVHYALSRRYENPVLDKFLDESRVPVAITNQDSLSGIPKGVGLEVQLYSASASRKADTYFYRGLMDLQNRMYNSALSNFEKSVEKETGDDFSDARSAFYKVNVGVLRAEMIDFIASMQSNVQTLTMDDSGSTRARVSDRVERTYDYSEAIEEMESARKTLPDIPYIHYNLGNLYCFSSQFVRSIDSYTKAIELYPYMGDAYFNRGLVLIYLKDREKGCIDLSRAGELGVADSYSVISKYCEDEKKL